jgi:hypothetical protein
VSASDELRFGPQRTLNLRENLPTSIEAVRRADAWLREQQVRGSEEVLVITGRGSHSIGGVAVIRGAIEKLLLSLHRRGVVASHLEHNPGAFVVQLAPLRTLFDAPARRGQRAGTDVAAIEIHGLTRETTALLHDLAERSLEALGVSADEPGIIDEMHRHLRMMAPALPAGPQMEEHLRAALRAAMTDYD